MVRTVLTGGSGNSTFTRGSVVRGGLLGRRRRVGGREPCLGFVELVLRENAPPLVLVQVTDLLSGRVVPGDRRAAWPVLSVRAGTTVVDWKEVTSRGEEQRQAEQGRVVEGREDVGVERHVEGSAVEGWEDPREGLSVVPGGPGRGDRRLGLSCVPHSA